MFKEHARGLLVVLMLAMPVSGFAQSADEVRIIQVAPGAFNAYGHWLGESGKLELRYSSGRAIADGWQISPTLQVDVPRAVAAPESVSPKRALTLEICSLRDSMYAAGDSPETVVAACVARLRESGLVDTMAVGTEGLTVEGGIAHAGGPLYRVYWRGHAPSVMKFGGPEQPPTKARIEAGQKEEAYALFVAVAKALENGGMVIVSSYPLPRVKFVPSARRAEALDLLRQAEQTCAPITAQSWPKSDLIDYGFAEQMRMPMPVARKERS